MKKVIVFILVALPFISNAQSKWGKAVWDAYMNSCVTSAKESMGDKTAKEYCACAGAKLEIRYPDANELTTIEQEEINEVAELCLAEINEKSKAADPTKPKIEGPKPPSPPGKTVVPAKEVVPIKDKLIGPTNWSKTSYAAFMNTCTDSVKDFLTEEEGKKYCDCSAAKLQVIYPDENSVTVTEEEINKIAAECLGN